MIGRQKRILIIIGFTAAAILVAGGVILKSGRSPVFNREEFGTIYSGERPTCPDPFIFPLPIEIDRVTSVLYPGQIRGGEFKAHGGFRFENSLPSDIVVKAPIDAKVIAGARYPVNTGDIQYTFDFENSCGIRYRLGHLLTLSPKFQEIANKFPLPQGMDSRTTQVNPPMEIKAGEVIATAVGMTKNGTSKNGNNTFLDWGVYDYRQKNKASQDPAWAAAHTSETYQYAVCWFDWISVEDRVKVLALPSSDGTSGRESEYCE
ncbi:hypothetical protein HYV64_00775 [Candidatus Shapirobacteria bacterium]|nr:hypothetical protein [Candidatus Shapirobacteria bacterium]